MFNNRNMFSTVAAGAKPENNMPAPNYKIQGPLADHTQQPSAFQKAATTAGANVLGKAGEAALFGVPKAAGLPATQGLWGSLAAKGAAAGGGMAGLGAMATAAAPIAIPALIGAKMFGLFNKGGAVHANMGGLLSMDMGKFKGPLSGLLGFSKGGNVQYKENGGEIASLKEYLQELYAKADAGEGWANDEIEATLIKIKELEAQGFKKGGKAKPMYAGEGMYTFPVGPSDPWLRPWGWQDFEIYKEAQELGPYGDTGFDDPDLIFDDPDLPVNYKKHGGITGPLSNNKSVKMERKDTIEYKN